MVFRKRYQAFLDKLQALSSKYDELTDTDVRERMYEVINYYFIWGMHMTGFPKTYEMMSKSGNRAVSAAVKAFVQDARKFAKSKRVKPGRARHALIEDRLAKTESGNAYDYFLGSSKKVLPATEPEPDPTPVKSTKKSKGKHRPKYDPKELAVKYRGQTIVPEFDAKDGEYFFKAKTGEQVFLPQDEYSPAAMRKAVIECFKEDY